MRSLRRTERLGLEADLDWAYPGALEALRAASATTTAPGQVTPWPLPPGHYFGLITGPAVSHGGFYPADRVWVQQIQQALIRKGYVPGITDPGSPWADAARGGGPGWPDGRVPSPGRGPAGPPGDGVSRRCPRPMVRS